MLRTLISMHEYSKYTFENSQKYLPKDMVGQTPNTNHYL
jgi:hypothetical protein